MKFFITHIHTYSLSLRWSFIMSFKTRAREREEIVVKRLYAATVLLLPLPASRLGKRCLLFQFSLCVQIKLALAGETINMHNNNVPLLLLLLLLLLLVIYHSIFLFIYAREHSKNALCIHNQ